MITLERKTFEQARLAAAEQEGFRVAIVAWIFFFASMLALTQLDVPFTWGIIAMVALLPASFCLSHWLLCGHWRQPHQAPEADRDRWAESTATILKTESVPHEDDYGEIWMRYFLLIHFLANGSDIYLHARVNELFYNQVKTGDILPIRYALEDLSVALLAGETGFDDL